MAELSADLAAKRDRLLHALAELGSCAVAFSGGLDSAVLAKAACLALKGQAVAVTGASASMAAGELDECKAVAGQIGIRHEILSTEELSNPAYRRNDGDRCYHCKADLFTRLDAYARQQGLAAVVDGSNADDQGDYHPGLRAARERNVHSPLAQCGFDKGRDPPTGPALGTARLEQAGDALLEQPHRLRRRGDAPAAGHDRSGRAIPAAGGASAARVRYHKGDVARIEVSLDDLPRLLEPDLAARLIEHLKQAGFKFIALDLEGFRSGSLNEMLRGQLLLRNDGHDQHRQG